LVNSNIIFVLKRALPLKERDLKILYHQVGGTLDCVVCDCLDWVSFSLCVFFFFSFFFKGEGFKIIEQKLPLVHLCMIELDCWCKGWCLRCHIQNSKTRLLKLLKIYFIFLSNIIGEVGILNLPLLSIAMKGYTKPPPPPKFVQHESHVDISCQDNTPHSSTQSIMGRKTITLCFENL
jgi:hypothetical protein